MPLPANLLVPVVLPLLAGGYNMITLFTAPFAYRTHVMLPAGAAFVRHRLLVLA